MYAIDPPDIYSYIAFSLAHYFRVHHRRGCSHRATVELIILNPQNAPSRAIISLRFTLGVEHLFLGIQTTV